jgi:hypothetical protein
MGDYRLAAELIDKLHSNISILKKLVRAWNEYAYLTTDEALRIGQANMVVGGPGSYRYDAFIKLQKLRKNPEVKAIMKEVEDGKIQN